MTTRIGLLHMDTLSDIGVPGSDYSDLYAHLFRHEDVEFVDVHVHRGDAPASLDDCDGWIAGGSRYSVYDDLPWIATAEEIVRDAADRERPLVGICFGHQLIAQALGGRTTKAEVGWGVGVRSYDTIAASPWSADGTPTSLLACHQDQVVALPPDGEAWSTSDYCPVAGMTVGERIWTMQGHPEFTPRVCEVIYESRRTRIGGAETDRALRTLADPLSNDEIAASIVGFVNR